MPMAERSATTGWDGDLAHGNGVLNGARHITIAGTTFYIAADAGVVVKRPGDGRAAFTHVRPRAWPTQLHPDHVPTVARHVAGGRWRA